jgi:Nucleotide modification associated domain 2
MKLFSYVVQHDLGYSPNPYFGICTLCRCKYRSSPGKPKNVVESAEPGDWILGTGGSSHKSAGHGKIVYAMRVDAKLTRAQYFADRQFAGKKPNKTGTRKQGRGDNERPINDFEKHEQFVLISRHFYYFGAKAIQIPKRFDIEKKGPGFRGNFDEACIRRFVEWLEKYKLGPGRHGDPCYTIVDKPKGSGRCKLSC